MYLFLKFTMNPAMCIIPPGSSSSDLSRKKHHVSSLVLLAASEAKSDNSHQPKTSWLHCTSWSLVSLLSRSQL